MYLLFHEHDSTCLVTPMSKSNLCYTFQTWFVFLQLNILGYVSTYYAIASAWPLTIVSLLFSLASCLEEHPPMRSDAQVIMRMMTM